MAQASSARRRLPIGEPAGVNIELLRYAAADDAVFAKSDDEIKQSCLAALARMYPHFRPEEVQAFRVSRVKQVFALSTLGYSTRVPPVATSVAGLSIVTSAQIVNGTLNVNEANTTADTGSWSASSCRSSCPS